MKEIAFLVCCLFFLSCNEEIKTSIVQGELKESCEGETIGNIDLVLMDSKNQKIIASTTTDANGTFSLNYEMEEDVEGSSELRYFNGESFEKIMTSIPLNTSANLLALKKYSSKLAVKIQKSGNMNQDTLFYSITGSNWKKRIISPENGDLDTAEVTLSMTFKSSSNRTLYWGLGEADYQKAKSSVDTDSPFHLIPISLKSCATSNVTIEL